jgi:hypothetical protein
MVNWFTAWLFMTSGDLELSVHEVKHAIEVGSLDLWVQCNCFCACFCAPASFLEEIQYLFWRLLQGYGEALNGGCIQQTGQTGGVQ